MIKYLEKCQIYVKKNVANMNAQTTLCEDIKRGYVSLCRPTFASIYVFIALHVGCKEKIMPGIISTKL